MDIRTIVQRQETTLTKQQKPSEALWIQIGKPIVERYGELNKFLDVFSPKKLNHFCQYKERCFVGTAPTLGAAKTAYGDGGITSLLVQYLFDLGTYSGTRDLMDSSQYTDCAQMMLENFYYLKITEIMQFFYMYKSGRFNGGEFYGNVNPISIMKTLRKEFLPIRNSLLDKYYKRQEIEEKSECAWYNGWERYKTIQYLCGKRELPLMLTSK